MYENKYIVYLLVNYSNQRTYLGVTENLEKKIREHNNYKINKIPYTKKYKEKGIWICCLKIANLFRYEALSIERLVKNKRMGNKDTYFLKKRLNSILPTIRNYKNAKIEVFI